MTRLVRPIQRRAEEFRLIQDLLALRQRLADAGLWRTYQAMDEVVKRIGWELAGRNVGEKREKEPGS